MQNEPEGLREALQDALDRALYPQGEWQPIKTAPKDGDGFLILGYAEGPVSVGWWDDAIGRGHWVDELFTLKRKPTHWMPLPEPPE